MCKFVCFFLYKRGIVVVVVVVFVVVLSVWIHWFWDVLLKILFIMSIFLLVCGLSMLMNQSRILKILKYLNTLHSTMFLNNSIPSESHGKITVIANKQWVVQNLNKLFYSIINPKNKNLFNFFLSFCFFWLQRKTTIPRRQPSRRSTRSRSQSTVVRFEDVDTGSESKATSDSDFVLTTSSSRSKNKTQKRKSSKQSGPKQKKQKLNSQRKKSNKKHNKKEFTKKKKIKNDLLTENFWLFP